jgi:hypothetical protein
MRNRHSKFAQDLLVSGGEDSALWGLITFPLICKNCAMVACHRNTVPARQLAGTKVRAGWLRHQRLLPQPPGR